MIKTDGTPTIAWADPPNPIGAPEFVLRAAFNAVRRIADFVADYPSRENYLAGARMIEEQQNIISKALWDLTYFTKENV